MVAIDFKVKNTLKKAIILTIIIEVFGILAGYRQIYFGVGLGGVISILNLFMISLDVPAVLKSGGAAVKSSYIRFFKRYLIIGGILFIVVNMGFREFIGLCAGVLIVRIIIIYDNVVVSYFNEIKNKVKKYIGKEG